MIWHTQGSGKSLLMAFLGGALMHEPALENPTLVVLTDRNDLDQQLFATFARCAALFGEDPVQADDIDDLRAKLAGRKVGGVIFTTIQKFRPKPGEAEFPELTDRSNVIVFVDEAHRSQYGFEARMDPATGEMRYGFAHHLRTRAAARDLRRLHRDAGRAGQRQHLRGLRRPDRRLRHRPGGAATARRCRSTTRRGWRRSRSTPSWRA